MADAALSSERCFYAAEIDERLIKKVTFFYRVKRALLAMTVALGCLWLLMGQSQVDDGISTLGDNIFHNNRILLVSADANADVYDINIAGGVRTSDMISQAVSVYDGAQVDVSVAKIEGIGWFVKVEGEVWGAADKVALGKILKGLSDALIYTSDTGQIINILQRYAAPLISGEGGGRFGIEVKLWLPNASSLRVNIIDTQGKQFLAIRKGV